MSRLQGVCVKVCDCAGRQVEIGKTDGEISRARATDRQLGAVAPGAAGAGIAIRMPYPPGMSSVEERSNRPRTSNVSSFFRPLIRSVGLVFEFTRARLNVRGLPLVRLVVLRPLIELAAARPPDSVQPPRVL